MADIEVKRKELETAKRIRAGGYFCGFGPGTVKCIEDCCPGKNESATECSHWQELDWDAFISTREAELAALEETPQDGLTHEERAKELTGSTNAYSKPRLYIGKDGKPEYIMPIGPTLDDFALALIQGGFYQDLEADEETHAMPAECLFNAAASLKAESDRRREA